MSRWLHIDINAYFATLLQQENPGLRGKPIGVLKSAGRTCVITASKEAKARGVRTGCSKQEAESLVPEIIFVPANFPMCLDATKGLHKIFTDTAPTVEIFSLDESFIDLADCQRLYPSARAVAEQIQQKIKAELGDWVTCNIGIARNRFLAKLASEVSPKGSITEITDENQDDYLSSAEFSSVCGIGYRLEQRLRKMGVQNTYLINFVSEEDLLGEFGPFWTQELLKMARGDEPLMLARGSEPPKPIQSIGRSITGYRLNSDPATTRRILYNLCAEVMYKARRQKVVGRHVSVYLSNKHGRSWYRHQTQLTPIFHLDELFSVVEKLSQLETKPFPVIKYAVRMSLLQSQYTTVEPLWEDWQRQEKVAQALDTLTQKYGLYSVRSGVMMDRETLIRPEVTGYLGDKDFQMNLT